MCLDCSLHVPRQYLRYCKGTGKDDWLISRSTVGAGKEQPRHSQVQVARYSQVHPESLQVPECPGRVSCSTF